MLDMVLRGCVGIEGVLGLRVCVRVGIERV